MKCTLTQFSFGFLFAAFGLIATPAANASLLLEPYVGYDTGSVTTPGGGFFGVGSGGQTQNGVTYGGRVGYESMGFMLGADLMTGSWTIKSTQSETSVPTDLGVFVGFDLPLLIRGYAVYNVSAKSKWTLNSNSDTMEGSGFKLGVGFKVLPLVSINVEYMSNTYTKDSMNSSFSGNITESMYGLSVSLPFTLP